MILFFFTGWKNSFPSQSWDCPLSEFLPETPGVSTFASYRSTAAVELCGPFSWQTQLDRAGCVPTLEFSSCGQNLSLARTFLLVFFVFPCGQTPLSSVSSENRNTPFRMG